MQDASRPSPFAGRASRQSDVMFQCRQVQLRDYVFTHRSKQASQNFGSFCELGSFLRVSLQ